MKNKILIVYSTYYFDEITSKMLEISKKKLKEHQDFVEFDISVAPGSFDIPFQIARSIKVDTIDLKEQVGSFEGKDKKTIRDNILQMSKLSQLNLNNEPRYRGYLALGCIIKGKTINHQAISTAIFTNLQKISIENTIPIANGVFNANDMKEAKLKLNRCTNHAVETLLFLLSKEEDEKKK